MTHIFQPLDLTVNGSAKSFLKAKFTEWFAEKIDKGLEEGKALEDIDIKLTLTLLKTIHGSWICDLYNYLSSSKGKSIIENGWKQAGISKAIEAGFLKLPCLDPFQSIDPLMNESNSNGLSTREISSICDIDEDIFRDINELKPTMTLTGSIRITRETFLTMKKLVRLCVLIILTYVFFKFDRYKKAVALLLVKHLFIFIFFASEKDLVRKNKSTHFPTWSLIRKNKSTQNSSKLHSQK